MPGVPPDAANTLKRAFKSLFKRSSKKNQNTTQAPSSSTPAASSNPPPPQQDGPADHSPTPQVDTKPPQLPPIGGASPLSGASESDADAKPVPPTHPLETGEQTKPLEAVPVDKQADPVPGAPLGGGGVGSSAAGDGGLKEPEKLGVSGGDAGAVGGAGKDVSPPVSAMEGGAEAPRSGAVSAVSKEEEGLSGNGVDGGVAESARLEEGNAAETSTPAPAAAASTTETADPAPPAPKENITPQTNGTSPTAAAAPATASTPADTTTSTVPADAHSTDAKPVPSEEKMSATMEEPPPIKAVRAAPGMSATSGPLEDFPEGGDGKD